MKVSKSELFEMQAKLCGLMANPKRLMMMDFLGRSGEASVGEIAAEIGMTISAASQHLRLMRDNNLVISRKAGHIVYYRLKHSRIIDGCHIVREVLMDELKHRGQMAEAIHSAG